jgi:membrane fusion protein, multidrug efflux system
MNTQLTHAFEDGPSGFAALNREAAWPDDAPGPEEADRINTSSPAIPKRGGARRRALILAVAAAVTIGLGWRWWDYNRTWMVTDNACLSGHILAISPRIAGTVEDVLVDENEEVREGEVLVRLDAGDLRVGREKASASLALAQANLAQAHAQVQRDESGMRQARNDFERAERLHRQSSGVISQADFDTARTSEESARGALEASRAVVAAASAHVDLAEAELAEADLQLGYTEIKAPVAGRIGRRNVEPGNRVQSGSALLALVRPELWVTANFKETQLAHMHPGQSASMSVDGVPGREFDGTVESISPASGAKFALLPPDNATGNFTKVVQRVPVRIVFASATPDALAARMVPGMSVVARVRIRDGAAP